MSMYMHVFVSMYMHVYVSIYMYVYVSMYMHVYVSMYMHVSTDIIAFTLYITFFCYSNYVFKIYKYYCKNFH